MIFGDSNSIAIEIGELIENFAENGPYVQFQFHFLRNRVGDWNDRIPLMASVEIAEDFLASKPYRHYQSSDSTETFFQCTYEAFYNYDYASQPILRPNLRSRFQLSEIGMSALSDKMGISAAEYDDSQTRIVIKDLRKGSFVLDRLFDTKCLDGMCETYIFWAREKYCNPK